MTKSPKTHNFLCSILDVQNASVPLPQRTAANSSASTSEGKVTLPLFHSNDLHFALTVCSFHDLVYSKLYIVPSENVFALLDWRTVEDPKKAIWLFTQEVLHNNNGSEENRFAVDMRKDKEEQDRSYVSFYKRINVEWASPLRCRLEGELFCVFDMPKISRRILLSNIWTCIHLSSSFP